MTKTAVIAVVLLIAAVVAGCGQLQVSDWIRVRTPDHVQRTEGLPAHLSLTEAPDAYHAWLDDVQRSAVAWRGEIDRGESVRAFVGGLALQGLGELSGSPWAAPLLPLLSFAAGWLGLRRPGDVASKEKEQAYNKGLAVGAQNATAGVMAGVSRA